MYEENINAMLIFFSFSVVPFLYHAKRLVHTLFPRSRAGLYLRVHSLRSSIRMYAGHESSVLGSAPCTGMMMMTMMNYAPRLQVHFVAAGDISRRTNVDRFAVFWGDFARITREEKRNHAHAHAVQEQTHNTRRNTRQRKRGTRRKKYTSERVIV